MRIQTLETDERILAFWIGLLSNGTFYSAETGYLPDMSEYEVGKLVFFRMVENLVREGAQKLDFGLGDADYKRRFADGCYMERDLYIFSRRPRGRVAAGLVAGLGRLDERLQQLLAERGWLTRVKTLWRRRLRNRDS
ncbi:MAG: hypothetical protein Kow00109_05930 [Acidobacteriota bacterium]